MHSEKNARGSTLSCHDHDTSDHDHDHDHDLDHDLDHDQSETEKHDSDAEHADPELAIRPMVTNRTARTARTSRTARTTRTTASSRTATTLRSVGHGLSLFARVFFPPTPPTPDAAGPPPDGGWAAWTACAGAHLVFCNTWGFINSFGVFQTYYADFLGLPPATISWIGSVQVFFAFFLSGVAGRLSDAGFFAEVYWLGFAFTMAGLFGASASTQYWQLMLAQGLAVGLGAGLMCCPTMSLVTAYFGRRRMLALGIVTCGNVSGGLVYPALARQMLPTAGFAWTMRTAGLLQLVCLALAGVALRPRVRAAPGSLQQSLFDWTALREPEYVLFGAGMTLNLAGVFVASYYLASFGRGALVPAMSYPQSLNLLLVLNGVGLVGRLAAAGLADRIGPINILVPVAACCAVACFAWTAVVDRVALYVWTALFGIVAGALQALFPAGLTSLTTDMAKIGQRIGLGFTFIGAAVIFGPPAAGAMVTALDGRYVAAQTYAGALLTAGTGLVVAAKLARMRRLSQGWFATKL